MKANRSSIHTAEDSDIVGLLRGLNKRVGSLERRRSLAFSSIDRGSLRVREDGSINFVEADGTETALDGSLPGDVTGLTLDSGVTDNVVYIDASWTEPSTGAVDYDVELEEVGFGVVRIERTVNTSMRLSPVKGDTEHNVRVYARNRIGRSGPVAEATIQTVAAPSAGGATTAPGQVVNLRVGAGLRTLTAAWDRLPEAEWYEVQRDTVNTFDSADLVTEEVGGALATWGEVAPDTYYVRARGVNDVGAGAWSATVSGSVRGVESTDLAEILIGGSNAVEDSSFESNSQAGWWIYGDVAIAVNSATSRTGGYALDVSRSGTTNGYGGAGRTLTLGDELPNLDPGAPVYSSVWVYAPSAMAGKTVDYAIKFEGGANADSETADTFTLVEGWQRLSHYRELDYADRTGVVSMVQITADWADTDTVTIDDHQVELSEVLTPYAPKPLELRPGSVGETQISDSAITTPKLAAGSIVAGKIAADAVGANEIAADSVDATHIAAGTIDSDHIVTGGLDAGVITFGTMHGDRIDVGTLHGDRLVADTVDANALTTSTLSARTITLGSNGVFRAGRTTSPFHYLTISDVGIKFYRDGTDAFTGGTLTANMDVSTGDVEFNDVSVTGSFFSSSVVDGRTQSIEINPDATGWGADVIHFSTGHAEETTPGAVHTGVYENVSTDALTHQGLVGMTSPEFGGEYGQMVLKAQSSDLSYPSMVQISGALTEFRYASGDTNVVFEIDKSSDRIVMRSGTVLFSSGTLLRSTGSARLPADTLVSDEPVFNDGAMLSRSSTMAVTGGTWNDAVWETIERNSSGDFTMKSTGIEVPRNGRYLVIGQIRANWSAGSPNHMSLLVNGVGTSESVQESWYNVGSGHYQRIIGELDLVATETVNFNIYPNADGNIGAPSFLQVIYIGP